jgi:hypothetical protein
MGEHGRRRISRPSALNRAVGSMLAPKLVRLSTARDGAGSRGAPIGGEPHRSSRSSPGGMGRDGAKRISTPPRPERSGTSIRRDEPCSRDPASRSRELAANWIKQAKELGRMKTFRFDVNVGPSLSRAVWLEKARKLEDLGTPR